LTKKLITPTPRTLRVRIVRRERLGALDGRSISKMVSLANMSLANICESYLQRIIP
jgi:hypothetical protein